MSKVVIDCRYLGMSGIGRFLENILENLDYEENSFTLLGKESQITKYKNVDYIFDEKSPYSKGALFKTDVKCINEHDVYFSPNFIIPFGIKTKVVVVFHDIIFLDYRDVNKNHIEFLIKKFLIKRCMKKADKIFTVSNFSQDRIGHYYPKYKNKISYAYPGVDKKFLNRELINKKDNYIVFVGNIKKHKGLKTLLLAFDEVKKNDKEMKLYIIGDASSFKNSDQEIMNLMNKENVIFTGKIDDEELISIVKSAKFLIQPSFYEGFGAPPLEALYLHTRPIISSIAVFKEVYGSFPVVFFEVNNHLDLANKILSSETDFEFDIEKSRKKFSYEYFSHLIEKEF